MRSFIAILAVMALMFIHSFSAVIDPATNTITSVHPTPSPEGEVPTDLFPITEPPTNGNVTTMDFDGITSTWHTCETSMGSPFLNDIQDAINKLGRKNQICGVEKCCGNQCTVMERSGSAALGICGSLWEGETCAIASRMAQEIHDMCAWNGRAGGTLHIDDKDLRVIVYHS